MPTYAYMLSLSASALQAYVGCSAIECVDLNVTTYWEAVESVPNKAVSQTDIDTFLRLSETLPHTE